MKTLILGMILLFGNVCHADTEIENCTQVGNQQTCYIFHDDGHEQIRDCVYSTDGKNCLTTGDSD